MSSMNDRHIKSVGDSLHMLIKRFGLEKKLNQCRVIELWPELVGENISKMTVVERIDDKMLFVRVRSKTWRTELLFQKREIIRRIDEKIGKGVISDIRFL
jgi:predicted nucleic acid-binding Zn ribbon protein